MPHMSLSKKLNLVIYRFREKGLEIFLVNDKEKDTEQWNLPCGDCGERPIEQNSLRDELIELDPVLQESGEQEEAWAVEGDWHDIPSLKSMLFEDALYLKDKVKEMDKGTFVRVKEALKKVMPHQYKFLKELKEILTDRNSVKDL